MQLPPEITFRDMDPSPAVEAKVQERIQRLERRHPHIMGCRVVIESHHRHHHKGKLFHVRIDVTVPGQEIVVSRDPHKDHSREDVYVAVRDAFDAMERQLDEKLRRRRSEIKNHEPPPHGRVSELEPENDFGRIETPDGRSIYFHRNSVVDGRFEDLEVGSEVRFAEASGDDGPQASTVHPVGKHHIVG